jgi:hypothetical protein
MAFGNFIHTTPASFADWAYQWISNLEASGKFARVSDSDGTTYASGGGQVTSGASGAHGYNNNDAWIVTKHLASGRQWCFQRDASTGVGYRIKYSKSSGFTGGSPGATRVPSASDESVVVGGGSDASPTFTSALGGTSGSNRLNAAVDASTGSSWGHSHPNGGGSVNGNWVIDFLASPNVSDIDPVIMRFSTSALALNNLAGYAGNKNSTISAGSFVTSELMIPPNSSFGGMGPSVISGFYEGISIPAYATGTGAGDYVRGQSTCYVDYALGKPATLPAAHNSTSVANKDLCMFDNLVVAWDGTSVVL